MSHPFKIKEIIFLANFKLFSCYVLFLLFRFIIKEKALTMSDLDDIWAAQAGKHEVCLDIYFI